MHMGDRVGPQRMQYAHFQCGDVQLEERPGVVQRGPLRAVLRWRPQQHLVGAHRDVVAALTGMPSVIFLARTLGRFDILATVRAFSAAQLVEVLDAVRALPGVRSLESWTHLDVVKESYASGLEAVMTS